MLSPYQKLAFRVFGRYADERARASQRLRISLQKAHIPLRPEVYLSLSYLNLAFALAFGLLAVLATAALDRLGLIEVSRTTLVLLAPLPILAGLTIHLITFTLPDLQAAARAKDIEAKLPYALNYASTMASAGIALDQLLARLADQPVYGQVAHEAAWIVRDIRLLGKDIVAALSSGIERSPSIRFQDFLQGLVVSITSGADVATYLRAKSDQFAGENRQEQVRFLDNLGVLAESFVTVVVAAPLFLIVLLSVLGLFGAREESTLAAGYALTFLLLPLAHAGFALAVKSFAREP